MSATPPPLAAAYLLHGEDRGKIERALARLIARMAAEGGMEPDRFRAPEDSARDVALAAASLSLGGTRLVICLDVDEWRAADAEPLVEYLDDPNPATVLALVAGRAPAQRLTQAVQRAGQVLAYGMPAKASRKEQRGWFAGHLAQEVARLGGSIGERLAGEVVDRLGGVTDDTRSWLAPALSREAEKLVGAAGGAAITREIVDAVVVDHPDAPSYQLVDAVARADAPGAIETLANAAARGDSRTSPGALQFAAARHFKAVAVAQDVDANPEDVSRISGVSGFPAQRAAEHASLMPRHSAALVLARLAQLELDLRVSTYARLGRSSADGGVLCWERAITDCVRLGRAARGSGTG